MKHLVMILMLLATTAQASIDVALEKLSKASGRIIRVRYAPSGINIDNICSATLVAPSTIATASHCFYRNPDEVSKHPEAYYFDITGLTSKGLDQTVLKYSDKEGNISWINIIQVRALLKNLPKIQNEKLHPEYIQSAKLAYINQTTPEAEFDVATARLSFALKTEPVKIVNYVDSETVYVGGYPGKFLSGKQKIIECISGENAKKYLIDRVDNAQRTSGRRTGKATPANNREVKLASYEKYHQTAVLNVCSDTIVRGFSGGPHVVVRNNEAYLVAVTSQMFESEYGLAGNKVLGAKLSNLQNISIKP